MARLGVTTRAKTMLVHLRVLAHFVKRVPAHARGPGPKKRLCASRAHFLVLARLEGVPAHPGVPANENVH